MAEQQTQEVQQEPVLTEFVYAGQRVGSDGKRALLSKLAEALCL